MASFRNSSAVITNITIAATLAAGRSAPCGRWRVAPGFNPGNGGDINQFMSPFRGDGTGGRNATDGARGGGRCAPALACAPEGAQKRKLGDPAPRVETRGYVPAPARGASPKPPTQAAHGDGTSLICTVGIAVPHRVVQRFPEAGGSPGRSRCGRRGTVSPPGAQGPRGSSRAGSECPRGSTVTKLAGKGLSPMGKGVSPAGKGPSLPGKGVSPTGKGVSPAGKGVSPTIGSLYWR